MWVKGTHALVHFQDEDTSSIVPVKRIDKGEGLSLGELCNVTWSDRKKYMGTLLFAGNFIESLLIFIGIYFFIGSLDACAIKQEQLEGDLSDDELHEGERRSTDDSFEKSEII